MSINQLQIRIQIPALARLQSLAAPLSSGEQKRFNDALKKLDPIFENAWTVPSWGGDGGFKWKNGETKQILKAFTDNGWQASEPHKNNWGQIVYTITKNGKWPCELNVRDKDINLTIPGDDTAPGYGKEDTNFVAALQKMAKKLLPTGAKVNRGEATWGKRGGYAGGKMLDVIRHKAESLGFKEDARKSDNHPDGSWVSSGTVYRHPDGWVLETHSHYGNTKSDNSYSATLDYDAQRG